MKKVTMTIPNMRATALAWWRSTNFEYRKSLKVSHFNDSRYKSHIRVPSITIERIFIKWLEAERKGL